MNNSASFHLSQDKSEMTLTWKKAAELHEKRKAYLHKITPNQLEEVLERCECGLDGEEGDMVRSESAKFEL
jgi:hypothetical protein